MGQKSPIYKHCHFAVTAPKRKAVGSNPAGEAKKALKLGLFSFPLAVSRAASG